MDADFTFTARLPSPPVMACTSVPPRSSLPGAVPATHTDHPLGCVAWIPGTAPGDDELVARVEPVRIVGRSRVNELGYARVETHP